ncbi:MAG: M1 family aminopeptidase, partial [Planctomycetota bacterium]
HPVYFFPIMAGRYEVHRAGDCSVYYHAAHLSNVPDMAQALDRSRRFYSALFSAYPFRELRIVEFPKLAAFAMGHPTLIPFSEAIGFLTKADDGISNINFMVTAHEAAHQWWGTIVTPARVPGAAFLTEGLAHFSTLLMEERFNGRVAARNRRLRFEREYLGGRHADVERPIVRVDGSEPGDEATWYNKGGLVFWMLSQTLGRDRFGEVLRRFVEEYSFKSDHPTVHDLLRLVREAAPGECEPFLQQWFYEVHLPKPEIVRADVKADGSAFDTTIQVRNAGTGTVPLEVEVANRKRLSTEIGIEPAPVRLQRDTLPDPLGWEEELRKLEEQRAQAGGKPLEPYQAERVSILLGPDAEATATFRTTFKPRYVLLDPDAQLLMSGRTRAGRGF